MEEELADGAKDHDGKDEVASEPGLMSHAQPQVLDSRDPAAAPIEWMGEECAVCFEVMGGACPTRRLSCGHGFHHACIQPWLQRRASCPLCKAEEAPAEDGDAGAPIFHIDLGHQEMVRIMQDLEDIFRAVHDCVGPERFIAVSGLAFNLCVSLGYEDEDELEEAIGGPLVDFLAALPHFEVRWPLPEAALTDEPRVAMMPEPDPVEGEGRRITFTVSEREDLWRVVLQGARANVEIPEIEFAIRPQLHRRVDTIYNMIASAVFHLGDHVHRSVRAGSLGDDDASKICETIDNLNMLLDVEQSFTIIISDRQGISEIKPGDGTHFELFVEDAECGGE